MLNWGVNKNWVMEERRWRGIYWRRRWNCGGKGRRLRANHVSTYFIAANWKQRKQGQKDKRVKADSDGGDGSDDGGD